VLPAAPIRARVVAGALQRSGAAGRGGVPLLLRGHHAVFDLFIEDAFGNCVGGCAGALDVNLVLLDPSLASRNLVGGGTGGGGAAGACCGAGEGVTVVGGGGPWLEGGGGGSRLEGGCGLGVPVAVEEKAGGLYTASFVPDIEGEHRLEVRLRSRLVPEIEGEHQGGVQLRAPGTGRAGGALRVLGSSGAFAVV